MGEKASGIMRRENRLLCFMVQIQGYIKVRKIDDLSGWEDALKTDNVTTVFSL